jgi:DNA-binding MarR family transcriptional regulator
VTLRTSFADADDSPGLVLWRVTNVWQAAQRAALRPFDLTHVQFVLLASLTWLDDGGSVTQRALAAHAGTDPMMTSQVLRTLEAKGLVRRPPHPGDARARALEVTEAGVRRANEAVVAVEEVDRRFFDPVGAERGTLVAMLRRLLDGTGTGTGTGTGAESR